MDRRSLRKKNLIDNQSNPSPPTEPTGGVGDRDINTGDYRANLDNDGTYQARRLFDVSTRRDTEVELNWNTQTADYYLTDEQKKKAEAFKLQKYAAATGVPDPEIEEEGDGEDNSDNPDLGTCSVCQGVTRTNLKCRTGRNKITFDDGEVIVVEAEYGGVIEYGAIAEFEYTSGNKGELFIDSCQPVEVSDGSEDVSEPFDPSMYGAVIYRKQASAITNPVSVTDIKEFQVYQNECFTTLVSVTQEGDKTVVFSGNCDSLAIEYVPYEDTVCVKVGTGDNQIKRCDIDPETLVFKCVARVSKYCYNFTVGWLEESSGEWKKYEACEQIGYNIRTETVEGYAPGADPLYGSLKYDSGIPRSFSVNSLYSSSPEFGYFQIYQDIENQCLYRVVAVKVVGDAGTWSGATNEKTYEVVYEGGCGFSILLGVDLFEKTLDIHDKDGAIVFTTTDFVDSSISPYGCTYNPTTRQFSGDCKADSATLAPVYEKRIDATAEGGTGVRSIRCV